MAARKKRPSPVLGTAAAMIDQASGTLVTHDSRFRHTFEAPLDAVRPDPGQARKVFDQKEIRALADTLATHGQLQPVLVRKDPESRGKWMLVAGERRWRAASMLKWHSLLAIEHDGDPEVASLIENLQRVDLTPVEEARGLERLIKEKGWRQDAAAEALGRSEPEISAVLRILTLPQSLQEAILTSELELSKNVLVELARVKDTMALDRLIAAAHDGRLTVRAVRAAASVLRQQGEAAHPLAEAERRPRGLNLRVLGGMAEALTVAHAAGRPLRAKERDHLMRLKEAITRRLEASAQ